MKVLYSASAFLGKDYDKALQIYDCIEEMGHEHVSDFVKRRNIKTVHKEPVNEWVKLYNELQKAMVQADVGVFEVSVPSTGLGQIIQQMILKEKPVITMHMKNCRSFYLIGVEYEEKRVQMLEYKPSTIREVLEYGFEIANDFVQSRFTMLMPNDLIQYLDDRVEEDGGNRSEYIRDLIRKDRKEKLT